MDKTIEKTLLENLDRVLGVWFLIDKDWEITHWSKIAQTQLDYLPEDVLGQSLSIMLNDELNDLNDLKAEMETSLHCDSLVNYKVQLRKKNGILIKTEISLHHFNGDCENCFLVTIKNITEIVDLEHLVNAKIGELQKKFKLYQNDNTFESLEEIYDAILVSITAGQGLRFNRAFLLVVNDRKNLLEGVAAIGPDSGEEANNIYSKFHQEPKTLLKVIESRRKEYQNKDGFVKRLVKEMSISLEEKDHIFNKILASKQYLMINPSSSYYDDPSVVWLREHLWINELIMLPLIWHSKPIGLLIADNQVTGKNINERDIYGLTNFAGTAGNAVETIRLLSLLENNIIRLRSATEKIKEGQAQLVQSEKLATLGEQNAKMAHEVRGPLAIIGGYARRILNYSSPYDKHYLGIQRIVDTVKTLESVVNGILTLARSPIDNHGPCDVSKMITKIIGMLDEQIHERDISVNINIQGDLPAVEMKEHHLFEVLNNLINNAIESIDHNGFLSISASSSSEKLKIMLKDSGPGIKQADLDKLFTPFFTTKQTGTGLGLSVVKQLVDEAKGELDVHSVWGLGATFTVTLQKAKQK